MSCLPMRRMSLGAQGVTHFNAEQKTEPNDSAYDEYKDTTQRLYLFHKNLLGFN